MLRVASDDDERSAIHPPGLTDCKRQRAVTGEGDEVGAVPAGTRGKVVQTESPRCSALPQQGLSGLGEPRFAEHPSAQRPAHRSAEAWGQRPATPGSTA